MDRIDKYIEAMYRHMDDTSEDVQAMKQEMKSHLLQLVEDLKAGGKSENESVEIAIKRFGEENQLNSEIFNVLKTKVKQGKILLIIAIAFLFLGVGFLIAEKVTDKAFVKRFNEMDSQVKIINGAFDKNDIAQFNDVVTNIFNKESNQIAYVAVVKLPNDFDIKNPPQTRPVLIGKLEYIYPNTIKDVSEVIHYDSGGSFHTVGDDTKLVEIGYKSGTNYNKYEIFRFIGICCIIMYCILFVIWIMLYTFKLRRLNASS